MFEETKKQMETAREIADLDVLLVKALFAPASKAGVFESAAFHSMFPADQHIQSNDYSNANAWGIREHYSKGSDTKDSDIEIDRFTGAFKYTAHRNRDGLESIEQATGSCQKADPKTRRF